MGTCFAAELVELAPVEFATCVLTGGHFATLQTPCKGSAQYDWYAGLYTGAILTADHPADILHVPRFFFLIYRRPFCGSSDHRLRH